MATATTRLFWACTFGLWAVQFGFLLGCVAYWALAGRTSDNTQAVALTGVLVVCPGLGLEAFLLVKAASYMPYLSFRMQWFNAFFYDSARALSILHIIWVTDMILVGRVVYLDVAIHGGPIRNVLDFLHHCANKAILASGCHVFYCPTLA